MVVEIFEPITELTVGEPQRGNRITVVPLHGSIPGPDYMTMSHALKNSLLEITELKDGATVPALHATNRSEVHVLILEGEELIGAMQNRVLNASVLLAPRSQTKIPVSCTESGRWSSKTGNFSDSDEVMPFSVRSGMNSRVFESLRFGRRDANQSKVWQDIDRISSDFRSDSPTSALKDLSSYQRKSLDKSIEDFPILKQQIGAFIFIDGRSAGMELVSDSAVFESVWPRLIRSYILDTRRLRNRVTHREDTPAQRVQEMISEVTSASWEEFDAVGDGKDLRLTYDGATGSALVFEGNIIHMSVMNNRIKA